MYTPTIHKEKEKAVRAESSLLNGLWTLWLWWAWAAESWKHNNHKNPPTNFRFVFWLGLSIDLMLSCGLNFPSIFPFDVAYFIWRPRSKKRITCLVLWCLRLPGNLGSACVLEASSDVSQEAQQVSAKQHTVSVWSQRHPPAKYEFYLAVAVGISAVRATVLSPRLATAIPTV